MSHAVRSNPSINRQPVEVAQAAERSQLEQKTNQVGLFGLLKNFFLGTKIEKPVVALAPPPQPQPVVEEAPPIPELPKEEPFKPYTVEVCKAINWDHRSFQIDSKEQETKVMQELTAFAEKEGALLVRDGIPQKWQVKLYPEATKVQEIFAAHFEIVPGKDDYSDSWIRPKILKKTDLGEGKVRTEYVSGIVTELVPKENDRFEGIKTYPNGLKEEGKFDENGILISGTRYKDGEVTSFFYPDCLSSDACLTGEPEFAVIMLHGEQVLALVQAENVSGRNYHLCDQNPIEAIYQLCSGRGFFAHNPIASVFEHPLCKYQKGDFLDYVLKEDRLLQLKGSQLTTVLAWAKELDRKIDLYLLPTLFQKWVGEWEDELNTQLLELYPEGLRGEKSPGVSYFQYALTKGYAEIADFLLIEMEKQNIQLPDADQWRKRAWRNETDFTAGAFQALDPQLKREIYLLANLYAHQELLAQLKKWEMGEQLLPIQGPGCLSPNMDFLDSFKAILTYLQSLRKRGELVTTAEWGVKEPLLYHTKDDDFGRVQGRDFIEETAKRLNLKSIKVPRKIVEVPDDQLSFRVDVLCSGIELKLEKVKTHAETIIPCDRTATREEMLELLTLLEATGYEDIHVTNFIVAEDGIYIIDTEFQNFGTHPAYHMMGCLGQLLAEEDYQWYCEEVDRRSEEYNKKCEQEPKESGDLYRKKVEEFGFGRRRVPFIYSMKDLG